MRIMTMNVLRSVLAVSFGVVLFAGRAFADSYFYV